MACTASVVQHTGQLPHSNQHLIIQSLLHSHFLGTVSVSRYGQSLSTAARAGTTQRDHLPMASNWLLRVIGCRLLKTNGSNKCVANWLNVNGCHCLKEISCHLAQSEWLLLAQSEWLSLYQSERLTLAQSERMSLSQSEWLSLAQSEWLSLDQSEWLSIGST